MSSEERFYLLLIQSIFYEAAFIEKFAGLSSELSEYEYKKLLIGFDSEILKQLTYQMHKFAPVYQYYFIDVLGIRRNLDFLPFLEDNFSHEDSEIRIRSLKAISEIGIIINLNKYKVFGFSSVGRAFDVDEDFRGFFFRASISLFRKIIAR